MMQRTVLVCVLVSFFFSSVLCKILSVQLISRHGIRAPNPVITTLCPYNMANIAKYDHIGIDGGGLTGKGMTELFMLGHYTRHHYMISSGKPTGLLSDNYRSDELWVVAVAEDRTIQSGTAFGNGLYPHSSAPYDFAGGQGLPPPIPVYERPDGKDDLLETRKALCKKQLAHDSDQWDATYGPALWKSPDNAKALSALGKVCGVNLNSVWKGSGDNFGDAIKDITDNLWFDQLEGFPPVQGLSFELFSAVREIAVRQLLGRLYGTPKQIAYMPGDLPETIITTFRDSIKGAGKKLYGYHGHREMMYAIAIFLNIDFDIKFPGLPHGEISPGGTIFIELHEYDEKTPSNTINTPSAQTYASVRAGDENYFVRVFLWYPCYNTSGVNGNPMRMGPLDDLSHCHSHPLLVADCQEYDCPLPQFLNFIEKRISVATNGDWKTLCPATPSVPTNLINALSITSASESELRTAVSLFSFAFIFLLILVAVGVFFLCIRHRQQKRAAAIASLNSNGASEDTPLMQQRA